MSDVFEGVNMRSGRLGQVSINRWRPAVLGVTGLGILLIGLVSGVTMSAKGWLPFQPANQIPIYYAAYQQVSSELTSGQGFSGIAKAVTPAVVTVETLARARSQPFPFFGGNSPQGQEEGTQRRSPEQPRPEGRGSLRPRGLGSGVIVSPDGYILTNNHVVAGAERVEVVLNDRRRFTAKIIGADPPSDVAVLRIESGGLPTIPLGDSNQVEVGDVVLAVGNPLGVGQTVTMGIISAKGRSSRVSAGSGSYEDFLQTDASINSGNSGGALVNMRGELIGVPSQILSRTGGSIGIGFAIPTAMARNVMDQLIRGGKVQRGKLGITISPITPDVAQQFGFQGSRGALVQDVVSGQPADRAGIKPGDIVTEFQGQRIDDDAQFRNLVAQTAPGTTVKVKIWRDNAEREVTATLVELDPRVAAQNRESRESSGRSEGMGSALAGVRVDNLTSEIARQLNLPPTSRGVVITAVEADSGAANVGLRSDHVIEEVNRQPIANVNEFNAALQRAGGKPCSCACGTQMERATSLCRRKSKFFWQYGVQC